MEKRTSQTVPRHQTDGPRQAITTEPSEQMISLIIFRYRKKKKKMKTSKPHQKSVTIVQTLEQQKHFQDNKVKETAVHPD